MPKGGINLTCWQCARPFQAVRNGRGRYPRFCSDECHAARKADQNKRYCREGRYKQRRRDWELRRPKIHRDCVVCGTQFSTSNRRTKCCGRVCGEKLAQSVNSIRHAKSIADRTRYCEICARPFVMHRRSGRSRRGEVREGRFCSRKCMAAAMRVPVQLSLFRKLPR